jgi:hypothetical protein
VDIQLNDLRLVTDKLFQHIDELGIESLVINDEYYWSIPREDLYQPYQEPKQLTLGQLSFDWQDLEKVLNNEIDPVGSNLVNLAVILRAIGYTLYD